MARSPAMTATAARTVLERSSSWSRAVMKRFMGGAFFFLVVTTAMANSDPGNESQHTVSHKAVLPTEICV
ncbi:hypothetical protein Pnap_4839 (plasmid) [Polaromonas naphthalenivorans CJ2]|uniref:Uncharacterized protein n=1 Tax=Polaromonas naphthalenivorans (strain CJ2) TaxID=365044 RepID=A1VW76_POLNA|nr:hypothetical protein Pnap_4839 [Polaromonas naphthalenivorans CJ2]